MVILANFSIPVPVLLASTRTGKANPQVKFTAAKQKTHCVSTQSYSEHDEGIEKLS